MPFLHDPPALNNKRPAAADLLALALGLGLLGRLGVVLESINDAIIGRVGGEVLEPKTSRALSGKHIGNPAKGVIKVPKSDTDAALNLGTGTDNLQQSVRIRHDGHKVGRIQLTLA